MRSTGLQKLTCLPVRSNVSWLTCGIFPASHYVVPMEQIQKAANAIEEELEERVEYFKSEDKLLEAQRISERTNFDIEMMKETGFCSGIENYSRHLSRSCTRTAALYTFWTISVMIFFLLLMSLTKRFHRSVPCMQEIRTANRPW